MLIYTLIKYQYRNISTHFLSVVENINKIYYFQLNFLRNVHAVYSEIRFFKADIFIF